MRLRRTITAPSGRPGLPHRQRSSSERRARHRRTAPRTSGPLTQGLLQTPHVFYAVPSRRTIGARVATGAVAVFGLLEAVLLWLLPGASAGPTLLLAAATLAAACAVGTLLQRRTMRRHDRAWYDTRFPRHVRADGRIACRHCGDRRIAERPVAGRTGVTEHACTNCSATLYYEIG